MFITNYHSIFAQRSYELILMEAGKVKDLKLVLQHESGLLFAEGYDNLGITVVESNPKIAKAEILLNSTHIRISAYKPGETFIIIYLKSTRKIYDVFRVGVESSVSIPAELNLLLGSEVSLFSNDAKKLSYINNLDAQWVSYDPKVVEIRNNSELHAIKEGTAKIALESTDGNRIILSSLVNVSSLNSVKLELGAVPTYLTDKKAHKNYQSQYVFPFRYLLTKGYASEKHLSDNQLDKEFSAHEIKMNLSTSCFLDSDHSTLVTVQTSADKKNCIVTVKEQDGSFLIDRTIVIRLEGVARTKSGLFNKESKIEITYHPGYITKTEEIKFLSNADFKHYDIVISKPHQSNELVITTQSPQLLKLTRVDNKFVVSVYDEINDEFESEIVITDNTIHESQVIKVSYLKVSSSSALFFLMMMLLVLFILICLVLWVIGGEEKAPAVRGNDGFTFTDTNLNKGRPNTGRRLFETGRSM